jgi:hypothetical protein
MRHLAAGRKPITTLDDLSGPMSDVLSAFEKQLEELQELQRYREKYGTLE